MNDVAEAISEADATATLSDPDPLALWHELANDPDSPDFTEITEHGEIVLSPQPTPRHQTVIGGIIEQLKEQLGGRALPGVVVRTRNSGIRCPDASWFPPQRMQESVADGPLEVVPPLVVEVLSPSNRKTEMAHKIDAYLESGAQEVVVVGLHGKVSFHRADGVHLESAFGVKLDLPAELFV